MENTNQKFDLEDRLVDFACKTLDVCDLLPNTKPDKILLINYRKAGQLLH